MLGAPQPAVMIGLVQEHTVKRMESLGLAMLGLLGCAAAFASEPAAPVAVTQRYALGQAGGWDYMSYDGAANRLFVGRGDRVWAIDADSGRLSGEIKGTEGIHGIALAPEFDRGFTSDGRANTVTVFDLKSLRVERTIAVKGERPDAILYDPASKHVLSFNAKTANASVIDAATAQEIATIPLPGVPEFAEADGRGRVYLNLASSGQVAVIDTLHSRLITTWSLGACEEPTGLALDVEDGLSFSTCQNGIMVALSTKTGKPVARLAIDAGPDAAAFDPLRRQVYSANGAAGTLSIYAVDGPTRFHAVATVPTQTSARTMALDAAHHRVFLAAAAFGPAPEPTPEQPHPRPPMIADSFTILVVSPPAP